MRAVRLVQASSLADLAAAAEAAPRPPGPGEITVRIHAASLNFHDYAVVAGMIATAPGRISLSDGAGIVTDVGPPDWGERVLELTDGLGVDHVVEMGGAATVGQSLTATRVGGAVGMIDILSGVSGDVPTVLMIQREIKLCGISVGRRADQSTMITALEATGIQPQIDASFDLADLGQAFRHQESGRHFGKITIDI